MAGLARRAFLRMLGGVPASDARAANEAAARARLKLAERDRGVASGVPISFGQFETEYVTALKGDTKWDTLEEMSNDPHIKGSLRHNAFSLLTADWTIEPASDDPRDVEIAEFVSANLLRTTGEKYGREYWVQTSWTQRLYEILAMLEHGYAMFAKSWRTVRGPGGVRRVYDRLQWLEPSSVDPLGWELDEYDNLVRVRRTYDTPGSWLKAPEYRNLEELEADRIALYPWELRGARYEGKPFIRSMYGPWKRKDFVQRMAAIWAQKVGAPVPFGTYPDNWPEEVREAFEDFVKSLRGTAPAEAFGMFPFPPGGDKPEVGFAGADVGEVDRMRGLVDGENLEIAHAGGTKAQMLGETGTGSRAVGDVQGRSDLMTVQAIAQWICEIETHGAGNLPGAIEELVDDNFAGVRKYPRLVVSKVDPHDGLETISELYDGVSRGIIPKHPDLTKQIVERLGYSLPDDAYEVEEEESDEQGDGDSRLPGEAGDDRGEVERGGDEDRDPQGNRGVGGRGQGSDEGLTAAEPIEDFRRRIASMLQPMEGAPPRGTFRRPNRLESEVVMLAAVQETFRVGERDVLSQLRLARREMTETLGQWLRSGKLNPRNLESLRQAKWRGQKKAEARLKPVLESIGRAGIQHVKGELERQEDIRGEFAGAMDAVGLSRCPGVVHAREF